MTQLGAGFAIPIECEGKYDNGLDLRIEQGDAISLKMNWYKNKAKEEHYVRTF